MCTFGFRQVECSQLEHVGPLVQSLVGHIIEFLTATKENSRESKELLKACDHMKVSAGKQQLEQTELEQQVTALGKAFTHLVDELLVKQIKVITFYFLYISCGIPRTYQGNYIPLLVIKFFVHSQL